MPFAQRYVTRNNENMHSSAKQHWEEYGTALPYPLKSVHLKHDGSVEDCENAVPLIPTQCMKFAIRHD